MGGQHNTAAACRFKEAPAEPADPALTVAKWLVPAAGVLFGLVGYVIDSAHRSLLAFPTDDARLDDGGRIQDAADFLRFFFTLIGDRLLTLGSGKSFSLGGQGLLLLGCTLAVAVVLLGLLPAERLTKKLRAASACLAAALPLLLVALVAVKFVQFDAPVMRIESVIVGIGVAQAAVAEAAAASGGADGSKEPLTQSLTQRLNRLTPSPVGSVVSKRSIRLWRLMSCARIGTEKLQADATLAASADCSRKEDVLDKAAAQAQIEGEFDAALWLGALILATAVALLLRSTPLRSALAVLALAYLLTVPYTWGKLLKPVDFSYAQVRAVESTFLATPERGGLPRNAGAVFAFVLGRDAGSVTLLQGVHEPCSPGTNIALRFSSVPAAKIVAIEQIFRLDVIEWALRTQRNCPAWGPDKPT